MNREYMKLIPKIFTHQLFQQSQFNKTNFYIVQISKNILYTVNEVFT